MSPETMSCRRVTILNSRGLHARAAAKFAKATGDFDAVVMVRRGDMTVSGLSIMGLMMLAAAPGSELQLEATGPQAGAQDTIYLSECNDFITTTAVLPDSTVRTASREKSSETNGSARTDAWSIKYVVHNPAT